jgi:hypothetical protein
VDASLIVAKANNQRSIHPRMGITARRPARTSLSPSETHMSLLERPPRIGTGSIRPAVRTARGRPCISQYQMELRARCQQAGQGTALAALADAPLPPACPSSAVCGSA